MKFTFKEKLWISEILNLFVHFVWSTYQEITTALPSRFFLIPQYTKYDTLSLTSTRPAGFKYIDYALQIIDIVNTCHLLLNKDVF